MLIWMLLSLLTDGSAQSPFFKGSVAEVLAKAKQENKYVVVDVYTTWCAPCKLMDRQTFSHKRVIKLLTGDKVLGYKIDAERGEGVAFARKYNVIGFPCILILDGDGKLVNKFLGFMDVQRFIHFVESNI